jgi:hypothetical protein
MWMHELLREHESPDKREETHLSSLFGCCALSDTILRLFSGSA